MRNQQAIATIAATLLASCSMATNPVRPVGSIDHQRDGKLIMAQVKVNGRGPYWFLVDSGASRSVIDPKLRFSGEGERRGSVQTATRPERHDRPAGLTEEPAETPPKNGNEERPITGSSKSLPKSIAGLSQRPRPALQAFHHDVPMFAVIADEAKPSSRVTEWLRSRCSLTD